jgi:hypothetical protein
MKVLSIFKATYYLFINYIYSTELTNEKIYRYDQDSSLINRLIFYVYDPIEITTNLYLGNSINAADEDILSEYNITTIINVTDSIPNFFENKFNYYNIPIKDRNDALFGSELKTVSEIIHDKIQNNEKVFVHCVEGRSRSVTVIIYYLMKYKNYSFNEAYKFIKNKKEIINLNISFVDELNNRRFRTKSIENECVLIT